MPTLLDVVKYNNTDDASTLFAEASKATPEVTAGDAMTIEGIDFDTMVATDLPAGDSFRNANDGVSYSEGATELRKTTAYIFNRRWFIDWAVAKSAKDNGARLMSDQALMQVKKGVQDMGNQFYYGDQAKGFRGLVQAVTTALTTDATGTGSAASSVYFVRMGPDGVEWVVGEDGEMEPTDPKKESVTGQNGNSLTAITQELLGRIGLMVRTALAIGRIKNLTEVSGKGLTDDLIDATLAKFKVGMLPTHIFMTLRSQRQLKDSRTATNPTGEPAPWPTTIQGPSGSIPIFITESLKNTETAA